MVWPEHLRNAPPDVQLPAGYSLRTHIPGDQPRFFQLMELAGWPGWNEEVLQSWLPRILPKGWFMAIHEESGEIVASAMALHSNVYTLGGELGWLASDPAHAGKGLGLAVSAAIIARFIEEGFRGIHLYTEDYRLAALKIYLKLGFIPFLYAPEMTERWQAICHQLQWPFTPEAWSSSEMNSNCGTK
jgi:mycothiol synthase